jgi:hypothetical protein
LIVRKGERQFGVRVQIGARLCPKWLVPAQQRGRRQVADHRAGTDSLSITDPKLPADMGGPRTQLCASALERGDQPRVEHATSPAL